MKQIQYIKVTAFEVLCNNENCFIDKEGNIYNVIFNNFEDVASHIIKNDFDINKQQECSKYIIKNGSIVDWLIIQGYIAIIKSKAYYSNKIQKPTEQQCKVLSCVLYKDMLIDKDSKLGKKVSVSNFKQKHYDKRLPEERKYFSQIINK